jgi:hypothetical protein
LYIVTKNNIFVKVKNNQNHEYSTYSFLCIMKLIQNNPYRILGLLVGSTAREQNKQINKLKKYLDAEQEPEDDFSFPILGKIYRNVDNVTDSAAKLSLDSDKMNAALFWFYIGNPITDEPAFDAIKEGDLERVIIIWSKLTSNFEVTNRNASAYSNLGTLYLSRILKGTNTNEAFLEDGISLKLKFLESDFIKDFKALATDETFKTTKKELQLLFLNQLQLELEKNETINSTKFLEILNKYEFTAKEDFLKVFVQKPIEQIEKYLEEAKTKRKTNKASAFNIGKALFEQTTENLKQLKTILGTSSIKYSSIADKVANELLQCSIDFFNDSQEKESTSDYSDIAMKLAKQAETIAVGKLTKDRAKDSIDTLDKMKDKEILQAIEVLQSIKDAYEEACKKIDKHVEELQYDTLPGFGVNVPNMRVPKLNVSINWSKVEESKKNALDWNKVVELIQKVILPKNIDKIKNIKNQNKLKEYKSLVNFIMSKLNYSQKSKVKYICYWETQSKITMPTLDDIVNIPNWIKWVLGIALVLLIIYLIWGQEGTDNLLIIAFVVAIFLGLGWLRSQI